MRSRGERWVLACAFGDGTRRRCGENGTAEDPGTVRQRVECLDLTSFRCNPECFWRHLKKPRGIVEVKPRFDTVTGAQRGDTLARPAMAIAGHQPVSVQDPGDEIVVGGRPDRLCRRDADGAENVRRRAGQARPHPRMDQAYSQALADLPPLAKSA